MQNAIQPNQLPGLYHTLASLPMRMDRLAMDTDWHFARVGLNDSNSFTYRTQRVLDQTFDQAFEIVMSSSLPCTKEHAAAMIVRYFYGNGKHKNGRYVRQTAQPCPCFPSVSDSQTMVYSPAQKA